MPHDRPSLQKIRIVLEGLRGEYSIAELCRREGIAQSLYYSWSKEIARFRDELLNGEIFYTLKEAQIIIEDWRSHYNTKRPHSALGSRPPAPETIVPMDPRLVMH